MKAACRHEILTQLRKIVDSVLVDEDVKVYLFGSWARQEEKGSSDIDIAIEPYDENISAEKWVALSECVEESAIPYHVDIVNIKNANPLLVENIKKEGVVWKDFGRE